MVPYRWLWRSHPGSALWLVIICINKLISRNRNVVSNNRLFYFLFPNSPKYHYIWLQCLFNRHRNIYRDKPEPRILKDDRKRKNMYSKKKIIIWLALGYGLMNYYRKVGWFRVCVRVCLVSSPKFHLGDLRTSIRVYSSADMHKRIKSRTLS